MARPRPDPSQEPGTPSTFPVQEAGAHHLRSPHEPEARMGLQPENKTSYSAMGWQVPQAAPAQTATSQADSERCIRITIISLGKELIGTQYFCLII